MAAPSPAIPSRGAGPEGGGAQAHGGHRSSLECKVQLMVAGHLHVWPWTAQAEREEGGQPWGSARRPPTQPGPPVRCRLLPAG